MAQFKQATPAGKKKSAAVGGGKALLPPVREPAKPVLPPVWEKTPKVTTLPYRIPEKPITPTHLPLGTEAGGESRRPSWMKADGTLRTGEDSPWQTLLDKAEGGAQLSQSVLDLARRETRIERAAAQASVDAVSGAAVSVPKSDRWKHESEARRRDLERESLGAADFQEMRRAGMQVEKPKEGENPIFRYGWTAGALESDEDEGRRAVKTLNDPGYAKIRSDGNNQYAMENLKYLEPEERAVIEYYAGKGEFEKVEQYLEEIDRDLNRRQRAHDDPEQTAWAKEHPVLGTGANIMASFASPAAYFANKGQMVKNFFTGKEIPTDINSDAFLGVRTVHNTEEGVSAAAREAAENATGSPFLGGLAEGGARFGLGLGRGASKLIFGPEGAAIYNGLEQAGESTASALERGATAAQADSLGAVMGSIELAAGLLPLEHLFSLGKTAPEGVEQVVTAILKQAGLSGGGAAVSELGGQLADTFIMGEQSEYNALVRELEAQGLEHVDAQARALADYWLRRPGNAARLGTLSGAIDATGALALNWALGGRNRPDLDSNEQRALDEGWADVEGPSVRGPEVAESIDIPGESGIIGTEGQTKDGLGELEWSKVVSKRGESRQDHLSRHSIPMPTRAIHGVFSGNPQEMVAKAWAQRGLVAPLDDGMGCYIYNIPFPGAGYDSGYLNPGAELDFITVIVLQGTSDVISVFPSDGRYGK